MLLEHSGVLLMCAFQETNIIYYRGQKKILHEFSSKYTFAQTSKVCLDETIY